MRTEEMILGLQDDFDWAQISISLLHHLSAILQPDLFDKPDVELDFKLKEQITQTRFHCVVKKQYQGGL